MTTPERFDSLFSWTKRHGWSPGDDGFLPWLDKLITDNPVPSWVHHHAGAYIDWVDLQCRPKPTIDTSEIEDECRCWAAPDVVPF